LSVLRHAGMFCLGRAGEQGFGERAVGVFGGLAVKRDADSEQCGGVPIE
jgi:hypothetical protein